jgi:hypothetical protein
MDALAPESAMQHPDLLASTATEQLEDTDPAPLAWLGGGLSLALWAWATLLAVQHV